MRSEEVKKRNLAITSMSAMLLATVAISMITTTTDNAFAGNKMYASGVIQAAAAASSETETSQETCEECFDVLSSDQQDTIVERVGRDFPTDDPPTTLEEFCAYLLALDEEDQELVLTIVLAETGIDQATQLSIFRCLGLLPAL
jgi:hypothetical protein